MTQDVKANKIITNMPQQVWPFCGGCGQHKKSAEYRTNLGATRCDECAAKRRRPRPWRVS